VPFTAYNVDEEEAAYDDLIARGHRIVPVTIIGDRTLIGYDPDALAAATAEWRAQPHDPEKS